MKSTREGDVVISRLQTAGRGREQREWISQEGGLWMTITLVPPFPEVIEALSPAATVSIVRTLTRYTVPNLSIKEPNDVYCDKRKIAGVLVDAVVKGRDSVGYLGMGVNLNNDPTKIKLISGIATSSKLVIGKEINVLEFAAALLWNFDQEYSGTIRAKENASGNEHV
jgi:BirA family transcriptional regulator, biotin operon repressor / biotin---[acetyl-CoA-carboxylase] ligase